MKRKRKIKNINWDYVFFFFILITFIYLVFFFNFKSLRVSPPEKIFLGEKYFLNKPLILIFLNSKKLIEENKEIMEINIKPNFFQRKIIINFKIARPLAIIYDALNQKSYYLDNYGRITKKAESNENFLTIISYKEIKEGALLNPKLKNFFDLLFEFSNLYSFKIKKIIIHSNFDISVINDLDQQFLLDPNKDHEEQIKKLYIFLEYQKEQKFINPKRIDLRIPQKIYFK